MAMAMTKVLDCNVVDCAYNRGNMCHTMAITVGAHQCPLCDTFISGASKGGAADVTGSVGACKEADCKFNKSLECAASGIHVAMHEGHADCMTFASR